MSRLRARPLVALAAAALTITLVGDATAAPVAGRARVTEPGDRGDSVSIADAPERVVFISDSALAGIRWSNNLHRLRNSVWDDHLESCRRLVRESCRGREGYRPRTVVEELRHIVASRGAALPGDVLLIAVGYNDWHTSFQSDLQIVMDEARRAGFRHVVWLTYREDNAYTLPGTEDTSNYALMNHVLRWAAGSGQWPELTLFDYDAAMRGRSEWFSYDGVHVSDVGAIAVAGWLSDQIRFVNHPELAPDGWIPPDER